MTAWSKQVLLYFGLLKTMPLYLKMLKHIVKAFNFLIPRLFLAEIY
jgi:hypothetical protein